MNKWINEQMNKELLSGNEYINKYINPTPYYENDMTGWTFSTTLTLARIRQMEKDAEATRFICESWWQ